MYSRHLYSFYSTHCASCLVENPPNYNISNAEQTACVTVIPRSTFINSLTIGIVVITGVGLLLVFFITVVFFCYRKTPIVKAAGSIKSAFNSNYELVLLYRP